MHTKQMTFKIRNNQMIYLRYDGKMRIEFLKRTQPKCQLRQAKYK